MQAVRFKVAALGAATDALVQRADEVDEDVVRTLRNELAVVLAALDGVLP